MYQSDDLVTPTSMSWSETSLYRFMKKHRFHHLAALHQAVKKDPAWFWGEMEKEIGLTWFHPYTKVLDDSKGWASSRWYVNGKMNIIYDAVDKYAMGTSRNKKALIWEGDAGERRIFSYYELYCEVNQFAQGLKELGVTRGDRVAIFLPMIPEAVVALCGIAKMGAIAVPVFSGYGAEAVAKRVNDCQAKIVITADGFYRRGKKIAMLSEARKLFTSCPSLTFLIVVQRTGDERKQVNAQEIPYQTLLDGHDVHLSSVEMDSEDPCLLLYTSGTTGNPKGTYHVHAGFPLKAAQDLRFAFNFQQNDTLFWVTDLGWMMGPWMIYGALLLGGTIVLFEGTPNYPTPDRLWKMVENHNVSFLGISPTLIRLLMGYGDNWVHAYQLDSLKAFGSTGEPWNPKPWNWLYHQVGKGRLPILNYSGGTEISGGILGCFPGLPQKPGSFHGPIPGMVVDVVDSKGVSTKEEVGELIIQKPWPGMTRGFWQDRDQKRYKKTYWAKWPDTWVHGDLTRIDKAGFWYIEGRSDDTLNIAGKRIGPAEYESALVAHPQVIEAATIGIPDPIQGTAAVCFVVTKQGKRKAWETELTDWVIQNLGKALKPKSIFLVKELPRTRNGKILRRVIRSVYLGKNPGDLSTLENKQSLQEIRNLKD